MKKLLFAILMMYMIVVPSAMAQMTIYYKAVSEYYYTDFGNYKTILTTKAITCDSLILKGGKSVSVFGNDGEWHDIDNAISIEASMTERNLYKINGISEYRAKKAKNAAISCFVIGTSFIFIGNIAADSYFDSQSDKLAEQLAEDKNPNMKYYDDWTKKIKNNTKIIRYVTTGIGAVFEVVGVCQTIKFSKSRLSYGINGDGLTVSYKF